MASGSRCLSRSNALQSGMTAPLVRSCAFLLVASACCGVVPSSFAGTFSVTPVRIFMTPRDRAIAVTLINEGDSEIALQAEINTWSQKPDGTDELVPTEDMVLSPPIIKLAAKARQVVRLASLKPPDPNRQLTYRLIVTEVPEALKPSGATIDVQVTLSLSMPVFITPPVAKREMDCRVQNFSAGEIVCRNTGSAYAQVRELRLTRSDQLLARFEGGAYILPGASKTLKAPPAGVAASGPAKLTVMFDDGKAEAFDVSLP